MSFEKEIEEKNTAYCLIDLASNWMLTWTRYLLKEILKKEDITIMKNSITIMIVQKKKEEEVIFPDEYKKKKVLCVRKWKNK